VLAQASEAAWVQQSAGWEAPEAALASALLLVLALASEAAVAMQEAHLAWRA